MKNVSPLKKTEPANGGQNEETETVNSGQNDSSYSLYIPDTPLPEIKVDKETFVQIRSDVFPNNLYYFKDKDHVYNNEYGRLEIVKNAVPEGFELVDVCGGGDGGRLKYTKDILHVFCDEWILEGADPQTFVTLGMVESDATDSIPYFTMVAKDKKQVYFGRKVIRSIDPAACTNTTYLSCLNNAPELKQ